MVVNACFGNCRAEKKLRENRFNSILSLQIGHSCKPKKQLLEECTDHSKVKTLITIINLGSEREREEVFYTILYYMLL